MVSITTAVANASQTGPKDFLLQCPIPLLNILGHPSNMGSPVLAAYSTIMILLLLTYTGFHLLRYRNLLTPQRILWDMAFGFPLLIFFATLLNLQLNGWLKCFPHGMGLEKARWVIVGFGIVGDVGVVSMLGMWIGAWLWYRNIWKAQAPQFREQNQRVWPQPSEPYDSSLES